MAYNDIHELLEDYGFLDKNTLREPYLLDVLNEILITQNRSAPEFDRPLATIDSLKVARNIKIPHTANREKNIHYLLDLLSKNYPEQIRRVVTFDFNVDNESKKLNVTETVEYTILLNNESYEKLISLRDEISLESLMNLIRQYRFFNLSALLKRAQNRKDLARLIRLQLGKNIFTFKNYRLDQSKIEVAEDYCFHADNYDSVRESINIKRLKEIISNYSEFIMRRLKKFGILSTDISDYRDSKLDYLFNILLDDLSSTISERDMIEIKNIHAILQCVLKVDTVLDPVHTTGKDIIKFIREHRLCTESDITASLVEVTDEIMKSWHESAHLKENAIIPARDDEGKTCYIDGAALTTLFTELNQVIIHEPEKHELSYAARKKAEKQLALVYTAAKNLLSGGAANIDAVLRTDADGVQRLRSAIADYEKYLQRETEEQEEQPSVELKKEKRSLLRIIIDFILSLFTRKQGIHAPGTRKTRTEKRPVFDKQTRQIYKKIINAAAPVIALSSMIELIPENESEVDSIITELQEQNAKIIIPVYNARKILYPRRSKKLLISDAEYLLVSPHTIRSYEAIREFTDSLIGYELRDEVIPQAGIMMMEKYLVSIYHQKRAQALRKEL